MFAVRLILLLFLVSYGFAIGNSGAGGLNAFGNFMALSVFVTAPALYLLPTYEAWMRGRDNLAAIALVNIFLGWSLVGWVVAMAWALAGKGRAAEPAAFQEPVAPVPFRDLPQVGAVWNGPVVAQQPLDADTKICPFCAEPVKLQAIKCKHCGSSIPA